MKRKTTISDRFPHSSSSSSRESSPTRERTLNKPVVQDAWRTDALSFTGCGCPYLLNEAIPAALKAGEKSIAIIDCVPSADADSDDESDPFVTALGQVACQCEALHLEGCALLSSGDLQWFFVHAAERGSLSQLSLCRMSGMDGLALKKLAFLLSTSKKLEQLRLGGLAPCESGACDALAQAIGSSAVRTLALQDCDTRFLRDFLTAMNQLPEGAPMPLTQLEVSYAVAGDASGRPTPDGQAQADAIKRQLALLCDNHAGLALKLDPRVVRADTQSGADSTKAENTGHQSGTTTALEIESGVSTTMYTSCATPPDQLVTLESFDTEDMSPPLRIDWNPRVVGQPGFIRGIGEGLRWRVDNPIQGAGNRPVAFDVAIASRIVLHLATGEPRWFIRLLRALDWYHSNLSRRVYGNELEALDRADRQTINKIEDLLQEDNSIELIEYAAHLRARNELPPGKELASLLARLTTKPVRMEGFLWAFNPRTAIALLVDSGRVGELEQWAHTLREKQALPPAAELEPLLSQYMDQPEILAAIWSFMPD